MALVDIGANLTHPSFHDDLDAVVARARAAGVGTIVVTGTTALESRHAALPALARRAPALCADRAHARREAGGGPLLHRRSRGAARLPGSRPLCRHYRLDLRRAPRHACAAPGAGHSGRSPAARDRFAV